MKFEPIAIVSQAGLFPGALSTKELYDNCMREIISITDIPHGYWPINPHTLLGDPLKSRFDKTISLKGGYISGFSEIMNFDSCKKHEEYLRSLDALFQWLIYITDINLRQLNQDLHDIQKLPMAIIIGNLSYPTASMTKLCSKIWLDHNGIAGYPNSISPYNRFMSGYPAQLLKQIFNFDIKQAFCIDSACSSALYAIKLACDALQARKVDIALAGGINHADDLFIHVGFTALQALSKSGFCRPLQNNPDGLTPAEGAGLIMLKRLTDAEQSSDNILGVIRGIGLSNDGRCSGLLKPSKNGEIRSMQAAYTQSGMSPEQIDWVECHATGTAGDCIEIDAMRSIFPDNKRYMIGAVKGNIGHMTTASGMGAIAKILESFKHNTLPPTVYANEHPLELLTQTQFEICDKAKSIDKEDFTVAINSFGFGGNNAHMILQRYCQKTDYTTVKFTPQDANKSEEIAIVGIGILTPNCANLNEFINDYYFYNKKNKNLKLGKIDLSKYKICFPPVDLQQSIGQQLACLATCLQSLENIDYKSFKGNISIFAGMQTQTEVCRHYFKILITSLFSKADDPLVTKWLDQVKTLLGKKLSSEESLGAMPNIVANRVNMQLDAKNPSFSVSAEELSGCQAVELAISALRNNQAKLALASAVDLNYEVADKELLKETLGIENAADMAITLALMRHDDAEKLKLPAYGLIDDKFNNSFGKFDNTELLIAKFGYSHCCIGMLHILEKIINSATKALPSKNYNRPKPAVNNSLSVNIENRGFSNIVSKQSIESINNFSTLKIKSNTPKLYCFAANDFEELKYNLKGSKSSYTGNLRLAFVSKPGDEFVRHRDLALQFLTGKGICPPNIHFSSKKNHGKIAFAYTGAGTSYQDMGYDLLINHPELANKLAKKTTEIQNLLNLIYDNKNFTPTVEQEFKTSIILCQIHTLFSREILQLHPDAVLGYCLGENNAVIAMDIWRDLDKMSIETSRSRLYSHYLSNDFSVLNTEWKKYNIKKNQWTSWRVFHPLDKIQAEINKEPLAHLAVINTDNDCIISGYPDACQRVVKALGEQSAKNLHSQLIIHTPEFAPIIDIWKNLHTRKTYPVQNTVIYSSYTGKPYIPTSKNVAEALTAHAAHMVDFRKVINAAWDDGVRIFIEHGPRKVLSGWIRYILKGKDFSVISYDCAEKNSLEQAYAIAAALWVRQVQIKIDDLVEKT